MKQRMVQHLMYWRGQRYANFLSERLWFCHIVFIHWGMIPRDVYTDTNPKLPHLTMRQIPSDDDGENIEAFRMAMQENDDINNWKVTDSVFGDTFNDGEYHHYAVSVSPTKRIMSYDNVTYINETGNWNSSLYVDGTTEWVLLLTGINIYDVTNGTVKVRPLSLR